MQVSSSHAGHLAGRDAPPRRAHQRRCAGASLRATVEQQIGRAELGEDTWGTHQSEFHIELIRMRPSTSAMLRRRCARSGRRYPGLQAEVVTFLGDRISESLTGRDGRSRDQGIRRRSGLPGYGCAIKSRGSLRGIDGIRRSADSSGRAAHRPIAFQLTPEALAQYGLKLRSVLDAVQTAYSGETRRPDLCRHPFRGCDSAAGWSPAQDPASSAALMISRPFGPVPLSQVARVAPSKDRYSIEHDGGQRRVSVTFNVAAARCRAS